MWTVNVFWEEDIPRRGRVEVWTPIRERTGWSQCLLVTDSVPATEQRALHHTESLQVKPLSRVRLFVTPRTGACQAPPSMGFFQARKLEWVFISFSRGSSWPRDWTHFSCIAGGFFTIWATREDQLFALYYYPSLLEPWEPSKILLFHRTQFADPKDPHISKKRQIFFINAALTPYHVNRARLTEIHSCNFMCQPSL